MHHRPADIAPSHGDQTVGFQDVDGFADGGWTDPELREQALLRRQYITLSEASGQDVVTQPGCHELCDPWLTNARC